jgi:hypothetical protein
MTDGHVLTRSDTFSSTFDFVTITSLENFVTYQATYTSLFRRIRNSFSYNKFRAKNTILEVSIPALSVELIPPITPISEHNLRQFTDPEPLVLVASVPRNSNRPSCLEVEFFGEASLACRPVPPDPPPPLRGPPPKAMHTIDSPSHPTAHRRRARLRRGAHQCAVSAHVRLEKRDRTHTHTRADEQ